jgi:hypothetical protein
MYTRKTTASVANLVDLIDEQDASICRFERAQQRPSQIAGGRCEPQLHFRELLMTLGLLGRITGYS